MTRAPGKFRRATASPRTALALGALALASWLAGCHLLPTALPDPVHLYLLDAAATAGRVVPPAAGALTLGLEPVELPTYLQNRALALRRNGEIVYADNHRWVEPLDEALARVVRARLLAAPGFAAVWPTPHPVGVVRDYDVTVRLLSCGGARDVAGRMTAEFSAAIEIRRAGGTHEVVARDTFTAAPADWDGRDYGLLTARLGADADQLAGKIISDLAAASAAAR
jgi:hypothetical protein